MSPSPLITAPLGLLPVLGFLFALVYLDSYKLVRLRTVLALIGAGALAAVLSYFANAQLQQALGLDLLRYSRYVVSSGLIETFVTMSACTARRSATRGFSYPIGSDLSAALRLAWPRARRGTASCRRGRYHRTPRVVTPASRRRGHG